MQGIDFLIQEILMIKESCNLIGREHVLFNDLKFYIKPEQNNFVSLKFNRLFCPNYF